MLKVTLAFCLSLLGISYCNAQSSPQWSFGFVPSVAQWNAAFAAKVDFIGGQVCATSGCTFTGPVITAASVANISGFNIIPGVAPTTPSAGDIWTTTSSIFVHVNGTTYDLLNGACSICAVLNGANIFTVPVQTDQGLTTTQPGWYAQITGDTVARTRIGPNSVDVAAISFGPGNAARDTHIERAGVASLRHGSADGAAPIAQTELVQNVVAGTSNTAGVNWTFQGSRGTGTGAGGNIVFQIAPTGTTGSAQNALSTALTIFGADGGLATGAAIDEGAGTLNLAGALYNNGAAPTGTLGYVRSSAPSFTAGITLGGTGNVGSASFGNATSGTITLQPPTGALGSAVLTLPDVTDTVAALAATQTFTNKTLTTPSISGPAMSGTITGTYTIGGTPTITGAALSGTFTGTPTFSGANFLTLANMAQDPTGFSLLGNTSSGASNYAPFTIGSLTQKASPASSDLVLIQDQAASGALKYATVSSVATAGSVASINTLTGAIVLVPSPGDARNMKITRGSATTLTITYDQVVTATALNGIPYSEPNGSHTLTVSGTGANGMDTGAVPANGFVCVYAISKGDNTTFAVLGVNAATNSCPTIYPGANMPAGYTSSGLIGIWPTSSSNLVVGTQYGRKFYNQAPVIVFSGTGSLTLTSQSISAAVPAAAKTVDLLCGNTGTVSTNYNWGAAGDSSGTGFRASVTTGGGFSSTVAAGPIAAVSYLLTLMDIPILTSQTIYIDETQGRSSDIAYVTSYTF